MGNHIQGLSKTELFRLGEQYLRIRNKAKAMEYLSQAVMHGNRQASKKLFELGEQFYVEKDYESASRCFEVLSALGHGKSTLYIGEMYEHGYGKFASPHKAFDYYGTAFQQGEPMGAYMAGRLMTADALQLEEVRDIAISWYKEAIAGGIYESCAEIGKLYVDHGRDERIGGPSKNDRLALSWFLRGAIHGDNMSRELAGDCFIQGKGTAVNVKRGLELYSQAFHEGSVSVCFRLGDLYLEGKNVHRNLELAIAWYLKAAERGDERGRFHAGKAAYLGGHIYPQTQDGSEEQKRAFQYLKEAATFGCSEACEDLADIWKSKGDIKQFEHYLKQGMKEGNEDCRLRLADFYYDRGNRLLHEAGVRPLREGELFKGKKIQPLLLGKEEKLKEAAGWYKKAAHVGNVDSWAVLAFLYLYYGDVMGIGEKEFVRAAKNGYSSLPFNTWELLWTYYAGPEAAHGEAIHKEDPRQAFLMARSLALAGQRGIYAILASYYESGYGTKPSSRMAEKWLRKS